MKVTTTAHIVDDFIRSSTGPFTTKDIQLHLPPEERGSQTYQSIQFRLFYLCNKGFLVRVARGHYKRVLDPPRQRTEIPHIPTPSLTAVQVGESIIAKIQQLKQDLSECKADLTRLVEDNRVLQERNTKLKETLNGYLKGTTLNLKTMEVSS